MGKTLNHRPTSEHCWALIYATKEQFDDEDVEDFVMYFSSKLRAERHAKLTFNDDQEVWIGQLFKVKG